MNHDPFFFDLREFICNFRVNGHLVTSKSSRPAVFARSALAGSSNFQAQAEAIAFASPDKIMEILRPLEDSSTQILGRESSDKGQRIHQCRFTASIWPNEDLEWSETNVDRS
jgi:hypothetical protein